MSQPDPTESLHAPSPLPETVKWQPDSLTNLRWFTGKVPLENAVESFLPPQTLAKMAVGLGGPAAMSRLGGYTLAANHPDLPAWWNQHNNRLFVPRAQAAAKLPAITTHPGLPPPENACLFLNGRADYSVMLWGSGCVLYLAESSSISGASIAIGSAFVFVGEQVCSMARLQINCRNGGNVLLESNILIASDVRLMSDDCHAIISKTERRRINPFGGTVWVRNHVWLGDSVHVLGHSQINPNNVIGARSLIRGIATPPDCVVAGVPARVVQSGITWDPRDLEPDSPVIAGLC